MNEGVKSRLFDKTTTFLKYIAKIIIVLINPLKKYIRKSSEMSLYFHLIDFTQRLAQTRT